METEIEELKEQVALLRAEVSVAQEQRLKLRQLKLKETYGLLRSAISDARSLEEKYNSLSSEVKLAEVVAFISEVSNPMGERLGFKFTEVVRAAIEECFLKPIEDNEANAGKKIRLRSILDKVLNNPIASAVLQSNPVTSVISKVVDVATNFVDTKLVGNRRLKDLKVATEEVVSATRIKSFVEGMAQYEELYGGMLKANLQLEKDNDYVKANMEENHHFAAKAYQRFLFLLSLSSTSPFEGLDKLFGEPDDLNTEQIDVLLNDPKIVKALVFVGRIKREEARLINLRAKFLQSVQVFKNNYITLLEKPLSEEWKGVDLGQLKTTIHQLEQLG
jgi:hypothetical protein